MLHRRTDDRCEVADTKEANALYGCPVDEWCILAKGHAGQCDADRDLWLGPGMPYQTGGKRGTTPTHAIPTFTD